MKNSTIDSSQVHDFLANTLPGINSKVRYISSGGCGEFALSLANELRKHGKRCKVVLVNTGSYDSNDILECLEEHNTHSISTAYNKKIAAGDRHCFHNSHIAVAYGNKIYDNHGLLNMKAISGGLSSPVMEKFIKVKGAWNDTFKGANKKIDTRRVFKNFISRKLNKLAKEA